MGQVLIKNVGNGTLNLNLTSQDLISFDNKSLGVEDISITYGTSILGIQNVAILSFSVNQTLSIGTELEIFVKTEEGIFDSYILSVITDET
jgi:hypothetical protein